MIVIGKQPYFSQTCKNSQMLFLMIELANKAEIDIFSA